MAGSPDVERILHEFKSLGDARELFSQLGYHPANMALPRALWQSRAAAGALAEDPRVIAQAGTFQVIYARLVSEGLLLTAERAVITELLKEHPYALFLFSNAGGSRWHFVNVKHDPDRATRRILRRITVAPGERLRTAVERLSLLDLDGKAVQKDLFADPALAIQVLHDEAFDVEAVTRKFFAEYARIFANVEGLIQGIDDAERRRLFTQRLFNRLMFIAFIQKKGWLSLNGQTDYLAALWHAYRKQARADSRANFYRDRLTLLFFAGLNTENEIDIIGINRGSFLKEMIGSVPYLNGGLFEAGDDDTRETLVVPDEAINQIIGGLFERFNFTVTESTPLDMEVAVDPEMLGKVFEELVTGRHESGSYYTPKPVVSFMCREALKGYLGAKLPAEGQAAIEQFVEEYDPAEIRNPEAVLMALRQVRVCDPACGSGAYLLGMLHELLNLRSCLFAVKRVDALSMYERKLEIIQQNVYGVDLDPFAVNIARLRLWLSLAVEFEGGTPPPLPNLDFKIETGDSLTAPDPSGGMQLDMIRTQQIDEFLALKAAYLNAHGGEKLSLRAQIDTKKQEIKAWTHPRSGGAGFDWQVEFAEVFTAGGFDIVVANPPYVRQELIKDLKPALRLVYAAVYSGTADLYTYFYARALQLLRPGGMLAFISSNKWFRADYGANLRKHIAETSSVRSITDFGELPVFESAATFPMIFIAQKGATTSGATIFTQVKSLNPPYPDVRALIEQVGQKLPAGALNGSNWMLTDTASAARIRTMEAAGTPLLSYINGQLYVGLKTGFNKAFWIDGKQHEELIRQDPKSAEIIKPLVVGDDVRKWRITNRDRWFIVTKIGVDIKRYPAIFKYLQQWQSELQNRSDQGNYWWELRACAYYDAFDGPKIVYPDIAKESRFTLDTTGAYVDMTAFVIPLADLYLLGVLNSSNVWHYLQQTAAVLGDADKGGRIRLKRIYMQKVPIPNASPADRAAIADLVQKCLDAKGVGCEAWEAEINERVARLYGL